jgi:APA family basic amino acid/polyamine antiporter
MDNQLKEKYGLFTAIAMVVGIVIGSGVFFKAEKVLSATGGDLPLGILAWILGGAIMIICAYTFSILATKYSGVNGIVDYADATVGRGYAYMVGWFTTFIYFPAMTSVLAWVSARYTGVLIGWTPDSPQVMVISFAFLIGSFALNTLSPVLAGKFQISTTIIKLIPLILMAIIGTVVGLFNGMTVENFTTVVSTDLEGGKGGALFAALVASAFAYEGWIIATSINAEIKNSKRNLPIALVAGSVIVVSVYIFYYLGLAGVVSNAQLIESGEKGAQTAFKSLFGSAAGVGLFVLVIISCLGTLNGLMLGVSRCMYAVAARDNGPCPHMMAQVDRHTNMPTNSAVVGLVVSMLWLVFFYGTNIVSDHWFGPLAFDSSELPIITTYAMYIPIFFMMMVKEKELHPIKRFVMPVISIICCIFMIVAAISAHKIGVVWYLCVFAVIMLLAIPFYKKKKKRE